MKLLCHLALITFFSTGFCSYPKLENLSIEEKIGQMLMTHFNGIELNDSAKTLIEKAHIGGIIYYSFSNPFKSPEEVLDLSNALQAHTQVTQSKIPLLISIDQEGGLVSRLEHGFTIFPSPKAVAKAKDDKLAKNIAELIALELKSVGVNMNLSPLADISSEKNPIIGIRSFGAKAETVTKFTGAYLKGYKKAQVISCMKHYPGHGPVFTDPHHSLPRCEKTLKELESKDLIPFQKLHSKAECIMTAHVLYSKIDSEYCATLSEKILEQHLRKKLKFQGVIVSDSLVMDGLLENLPNIEEASLKALQAGCDLLILGGKKLFGKEIGFELTPNDILKIHKFLCMAVREGKLNRSKIDQSVQRILKMKKKYRLFERKSLQTTKLKHCIDTAKARSLIQKVAEKSLDISIQKELKHPASSYNLIAPTILSKAVLNSSMPNVFKNLVFYDSLNPSDKEIEQILSQTDPHSNLLILTYKAWKNPKQLDLLKKIKENREIILLSSTEEIDTENLKKLSHVLLLAHSPTPSCLDASLNALSSYLPPSPPSPIEKNS